MMAINKAIKWMQKPVSIAPLASFRILFGSMMLLSIIRFWLKGWITSQYVYPTFHFTFTGFGWVRPLGNVGIHLLFIIMGLSALFIALGFWYRTAMVTFFALFTYVELIDVTYYLNHYYFISLISFLMIWLPCGRFFSLDTRLNPSIKITETPRWVLGTIRLQLGIVYFFAGLAKVNPDWLLEAQPMKLWLPTKSHLPLIGNLMYKEWVAYFFSWFGAVYDLCIAFFLINYRTRPWAYLLVLVFHIATAIFFPAIGMFPYIMVICTLIFFSGKFHLKLINLINKRFAPYSGSPFRLYKTIWQKPLLGLLGVFFLIQLILPVRYLFYPGHLFWTEEGYRFSWRVMLMEKVGTTNFMVYAPQTHKKYEVNNKDFLTPQQEKMMATQPDMILQYAHYLAKMYAKRGIKEPHVYVDAYVTLNGKRSKPYIDNTVNLAAQHFSFKHYRWILPY